MGRLTISSGLNSVNLDISGKNLLSEIKRLLPLDRMPAETGYLDFCFYVNGNLIDLNSFNIDRKFNSDVAVIIPPKGPETIAIIQVVSAVISLLAAAASFLLAPDTPSSTGSNDSANNALFGQTNQIRLGELEPNIYGTQISYPDLIVGEGGAWGYENNKKIVKQLFLIGIGDYEVEEPKFELTDFSSITGQDYAIYTPEKIVPIVQGQFNSEAVDGQVLLGPNNDEVEGTLTAKQNRAGMKVTIDPEGGEDLFIELTVSFSPDWTAIKEAVTNEETGSLTEFWPMRFTYGYDAGDDDFGEIDVTGELYNMELNAEGTKYTLYILSRDAVDDTDFDGQIDFTLISPDSYLEIELPVPTDELQVSFEFLRGLRSSVKVAVYVLGLSSYIKYEFIYTANTSNQQFFTEKMAVSPTDNGNLSVRIVRFSDESYEGFGKVQVSQVATNEYRRDVDYGDRTILETSHVATTAATSTKSSKINCKVTRKVISWDQDLNAINLVKKASRSFADAILHEYVVVHGLEYEDLPIDDMYQIDESLSDGFNYFDHTFADKEQSLKETLSIIANTVRCKISTTGQGFEIYRDERRLPAAQLDSRNISIESAEEYSYRGASLVSNDGVKLTYKNLSNNKFEYIYCALVDGVSLKCVYNGDGTYTPPLPTNPLEIDLVGSSVYLQADNRAHLECRSLVYIQKTLSTTILKDGLDLSRGQLVRHSDYYQEDVCSGEISFISGDYFTTHNQIELPDGMDYYITYTDEMGGTFGPIPCTIVGDNAFVASMPNAYLSDGYSIQSGSRFIISTLTEHANNLYVINNKKPNSNGTVTLELIEYSELIYPEES